jgi:transcriptional regulator with XRE-family HTH domain
MAPPPDDGRQRMNVICYLKPYRRRWGLSQSEVAVLIGVQSRSVVSRIERGIREPSFRVAVACEVLFGASIGELFPHMFADVEEQVVTRAYDLYERLQGSTAPSTTWKLDFFEEMFARREQKVTARL